MPKMKAVFCPRYGPPEVLEFREVEMPVPSDDEIRVRVHATTVCAADSRVRGFRVPRSNWIPARLVLGLRKPRQPILGAEFAGEVESVGRNVRRFEIGDAVFGSTSAGHTFGAHAEFCCVPEAGIVAKKPTNSSYEEAAAVPFGGRAALHFLRQANVQPGQAVLIYGASGSLGTYAVQIAKHLGAEVTGVCSGANAELVRSLGADVVIDYTTEDFSTRGHYYDVIFDTVGKSSLSSCMRTLKQNGVYLQAVASLGLSVRMRWTSLRTGKKLIGGVTAPNPEYLTYLAGLLESGALKPVIDRTYAFKDIVEAHRYVDSGHKRGNVVITVTADSPA